MASSESLIMLVQKLIYPIGVCDSSYAMHRPHVIHVHVLYSHIVTVLVCTLLLKQESPFLQEWLIRNGGSVASMHLRTN